MGFEDKSYDEDGKLCQTKIVKCNYTPKHELNSWICAEPKCTRGSENSVFSPIESWNKPGQTTCQGKLESEDGADCRQLKSEKSFHIELSEKGKIPQKIS